MYGYHPNMRSRWLNWPDLFLCVVVTELDPVEGSKHAEKIKANTSQVDQMTLVDIGLIAWHTKHHLLVGYRMQLSGHDSRILPTLAQ